MSLDSSRDTGEATRVPRSVPKGPGARNGACAARPAPGPAGADPGPPEAAPLVYRKQSRGTDSDDLRRTRFVRRAQSASWVIDSVSEALEVVNEETGEISMDWPRVPRLAKCSWRRNSDVPVHAADGKAHYSGLERCSSIWACPVCAAVVRAERAREIEKAVTAHQAAGGSALFVTLTIRHSGEDSLAQSLDAVLTSWQKILGSRAWRGGKRQIGLKEKYGVTGYIRSTEITHGDNGWHPHIHSIILVDRDLSTAELTTLGDDIHDQWASRIEKATGKTPTREHGIDVQKVDTKGKVLAKYLSKVQDEGKPKTEAWSVSAELARSDVKNARAFGSRVPFELLDSDDPMPRNRRYALWLEYVAATKGRRAITWSRGLKASFEIDDKTDEEIIEETESAPARWLAEGEGYDSLRRRDPKGLAVVLEFAEVERWDDVADLLPGRPIYIDDSDDDADTDPPDPVALAKEKFEDLMMPLLATANFVRPMSAPATSVHELRLRALALKVGERLESPDHQAQFLDSLDDLGLKVLRAAVLMYGVYVRKPSTRVAAGIENLRRLIERTETEPPAC